jgi:phage terminase large subunit-like protein
MEAQDDVVVTHGTIYDNPALAQSAIAALERRYGGTRLGRQELMGEYVDAIEGALWQMEWIDDARRSEPPTAIQLIEENGIEEHVKILEMPRIVVAVDPAVTAKSESDYTAIAVAGLGPDGDYYLLHAEAATPVGAAGNRCV